MAIIHDEYQNELVLPREEQIPSDSFRKGEPVKALVKSVEIRGSKPNVILACGSAFPRTPFRAGNTGDCRRHHNDKESGAHTWRESEK